MCIATTLYNKGKDFLYSRWIRKAFICCELFFGLVIIPFLSLVVFFAGYLLAACFLFIAGQGIVLLLFLFLYLFKMTTQLSAMQTDISNIRTFFEALERKIDLRR